LAPERFPVFLDVQNVRRENVWARENLVAFEVLSDALLVHGSFEFLGLIHIGLRCLYGVGLGGLRYLDGGSGIAIPF
jgi:hypothetical protein